MPVHISASMIRLPSSNQVRHWSAKAVSPTLRARRSAISSCARWMPPAWTVMPNQSAPSNHSPPSFPLGMLMICRAPYSGRRFAM